MNSKWNYLGCGLNIMIALLGAVTHDVLLVILGLFFAVFNYYAGENRRRLEDESIRESFTETEE